MAAVPSTPFTREFFAFNTTNRVSAWTADAAALDEVVALCVRYEKLFSRTDPISELTRLNLACGEPMDVDGELAALTSAAFGYSKASGGLYDVTMGAVVRLWDFKGQVIPTEQQIAEALCHVDYRRVHVEGATVQLEDPLATIDLGGIAKGYIADRLIETLVAHGVESALVNLGGNVAVLGGKPDGTAWRIGLRRPQSSLMQQAPQSFGMFEVRDRSVVTSGVYERAFEREGRLYHHILDPRSGYPADTDLLGASVVAERSLDADGYSTALIIMGLDKALGFIEDQPGLEAVFVTTSGEVYASSGIGTLLPFKLLDC
ncbi:MAG: FAD:protein FMN transferase [Coriobacteriia bacterium]|nr:FAD:protein FMN transferase [Coriobacteriia bacterium]